MKINNKNFYWVIKTFTQELNLGSHFYIFWNDTPGKGMYGRCAMAYLIHLTYKKKYNKDFFKIDDFIVKSDSVTSESIREGLRKGYDINYSISECKSKFGYYLCDEDSQTEALNKWNVVYDIFMKYQTTPLKKLIELINELR